ncbi:hypothetical protein ACQV2E_06455 [Pantoea allii]|uniref:hypothetical protein n=1 Tax=Pantoea allii TaxID=574096 RepID=UPI003D31C1BD
MLTNKSNKELVEAGHQFAKALDADMPLTDIAKLVSALATRLDCAIIRGNELQQKLDAMAQLAEERRQFIVNGVDLGYIELPVVDDDKANYIYERCGKINLHDELVAYSNQLRSGTHDTADKAG